MANVGHLDLNNSYSWEIEEASFDIRQSFKSVISGENAQADSYVSNSLKPFPTIEMA